MTIVVERAAVPYASPANVLEVVHRYRDRNLPEEIDVKLLSEIGIPKGNVHRTLSALQFLGLLDDAGSPTAAFASLQMASDPEYQTIFEGLVRSGYREVFKVIDPAKDTQFVIDNHFRRYSPQSQRHRMITLFLALCREAGIPTIDTPRQRKMKGGVGGSSIARRVPPLKFQTGPEAVLPPPGSDMASPQETVSSLRREYIAALIERIKHQESIDPSLLDRVEKLLEQEEQQTAERPRG